MDHHHAIVVGGSYAGLSAALQLARARRRVLVIDAGQRRNRFAASSHGLLGQDGRDAGAIVEDARAQLLRYPTVTWLAGTATSAARVEGGFSVTTAEGAVEGDRVILAGGVTDDLPDLPGLSERWGRSVFHCPYCHGYEIDEGRIGVLATSPAGLHQAMLLPDWGPTTLFTDGAFEPDDAQRADLARRGVALERARVDRIAGERADVALADGRIVALDALFVAPRTEPVGSLAQDLGCDVGDGPMGRFVAVDGQFHTSAPGVFACGDVTRGGGSVPLAVGDGAMAGVSAHRSLVLGLS